MSITNQQDDKDQQASAYACGSLGLSNYANADVKAFAEQTRLDQARGPFAARHAASTNKICHLRELEASSVVDLESYRSILEHFGARR